MATRHIWRHTPDGAGSHDVLSGRPHANVRARQTVIERSSREAGHHHARRKTYPPYAHKLDVSHHCGDKNWIESRRPETPKSTTTDRKMGQRKLARNILAARYCTWPMPRLSKVTERAQSTLIEFSRPFLATNVMWELYCALAEIDRQHK